MTIPSLELWTVRGLLTYQNLIGLQRKFDDTGTYTYVGTAICGQATSTSLWSIKRITNADGTIEWAKLSTDTVGNSDFSKVYDDRASYTYN